MSRAIRSLLLVCLGGLGTAAAAQQADSFQRTRIGVVGSLAQGSGTAFDLGFAYSSDGLAGPHSYFGAVALSAEVALADSTLTGPKVTAWTYGGAGAMGLGLSAAYLSHWTGDPGVFLLRPEIGIGLMDVMVAYGYGGLSLGERPAGLSRHYAVVRVFISP